MHAVLPLRPAPPRDPSPSPSPSPASFCNDADERDASRLRQAHKLAADAIAVSHTILSEITRLLDLDVAANPDNRPHAPAKPRILLTNLTRQLQREGANAQRYLDQFLSAPDDDVVRDLAFTRLSCLNITFYDTLWAVLKAQRGLVSALREIEVPGPRRRGTRRNMAKVDAMVENGAEWIKIITADPRRLLFQMTGAGWDWEVEEGEPAIDLRDDDESGIEAIDTVRDLLAAAAVTRIGPYHYQTPKVRVMFPRITEGESAHIDALLGMIRTLGEGHNVSLSVECGGPDPSPANGDPTPDDALLKLVPSEDFFFSPVVNLDCTILFNMGSDTAHFLPDSFQARTEARIKEDLEDERKNGPRLPRSIYPALGGRALVCTDEVAVNFRNTVIDIGTDTEIARANLLLPPEDGPIPTLPPTEAQRKETLKRFQDLSVHPVPPDLQLPIQVVETPSHEEVERMVEAGTLPRVLLRLDERIKSMNASAVVQGWAREQTTLTSNRQGMNLINQIVAEGGDEAARAGNALHVWMAPFGRRLAAKPKRGVESAEEPEATKAG
ncbi:hypothetical protein IMZ48_42925 [Candidatus Bathyarchaeota archaeon]|nr:hypothetical protein [Candidatus Bathyarchaeota archaeon]